MIHLPWLRLYTDILDDPKMKRLTLRQKWIWITILCLAQKSPVRGQLMLTSTQPLSLTDIALAVGLTPDDCTDEDDAARHGAAGTQYGPVEYMIAEALEQFAALEMITYKNAPVTGCNGVVTACNFLKRQYQKASNAPEAIRRRVERHRKSKCNANVTPPCNTDVTRSNALDTDTDTDTDSETTTTPPCATVLREELPETSVNFPTPSGLRNPLPPSNPLEARFHRFWQVYPKRRSKHAAWRVWRRLKPSEQLTDLILAAVQRALTSATWRKDGGEFIPYPATWLNAGGWEDELNNTTSAADPWARYPKLGQEVSHDP